MLPSSLLYTVHSSVASAHAAALYTAVPSSLMEISEFVAVK